MVELAFTIPILALILLIIIDVGLVVREHQLVQNAAREGARFSSLPENWVSPLNPEASIAAIQQRVVDYCREEGIVINAADVTVNQDYPIPIAGGRTVYGSEITVTYSRSMLLLGIPLLPTNSITITGRSVFRNLYGG